jgi:hypothetical protein
VCVSTNSGERGGSRVKNGVGKVIRDGILAAIITLTSLIIVLLVSCVTVVVRMKVVKRNAGVVWKRPGCCTIYR